MSGPANKAPVPSQVRVTLDGQLVGMSQQIRASLPAIRAHLEALVLCQRRILHGLVVDGVTPDLQRPAWSFDTSDNVVAATIRFDELAFQLLRLAREQVGQLRARGEAAVPLVLINEWPGVQRICWNLLPDLKEPLVTLGLLPELGRPTAGPLVAPAAICASQAQELGRIQQEVSGHCAFHDALASSDTLRHRLLPWLAQFHTMLAQLHEVTQA